MDYKWNIGRGGVCGKVRWSTGGGDEDSGVVC